MLLMTDLGKKGADLSKTARVDCRWFVHGDILRRAEHMAKCNRKVIKLNCPYFNRFSKAVFFLSSAVIGLSDHFELGGITGTKVGIPKGYADGIIVFILVHWWGEQGQALRLGILVEDVEVGIAHCGEERG